MEFFLFGDRRGKVEDLEMGETRLCRFGALWGRPRRWEVHIRDLGPEYARREGRIWDGSRMVIAGMLGGMGGHWGNFLGINPFFKG
ncbi:MAG: hypothetical protein DRN55_06515 [Thermoplasmata archaeon]|nr:MAG: hypothetical protein DRN55_06515 [Thermoplasmata archaeon]